jgi:hypothetical protein
MEDKLIEFETAKLATEKGYVLRFAGYNYSEENNYELSLNVYTKEDLIKFKIFAAPTQSFLQKWLRETHGFHIFITPREKDNYQYNFTNNNNTDITLKNNGFKTYEEALEKALQSVLNLI